MREGGDRGGRLEEVKRKESDDEASPVSFLLFLSSSSFLSGFDLTVTNRAHSFPLQYKGAVHEEAAAEGAAAAAAAEEEDAPSMASASDVVGFSATAPATNAEPKRRSADRATIAAVRMVANQEERAMRARE